MTKWDFEDVDLDFLESDAPKDQEAQEKPCYKVLISDDDEEVHRITKLVLKNFEFEDYGIELLHAYSGKETLEICDKNKDIAVLFLDVVMEENHSGLDVVRVLREEQKNKFLRIILRTGQPGQAPEEEVIYKYDINDYRLKTEMTAKRLYTSLYVALRNYRDMVEIEKHKQGLQRIIEASGRLFRQNSLDEYLSSVLDELSNFQKQPSVLAYIREQAGCSHGFVTFGDRVHKIAAATGKFKDYIGKELCEMPNYREVKQILQEESISAQENKQAIYPMSSGFLVVNKGQNKVGNYIYVDGKNSDFDFDLIKVFLANFSVSLDNYIINKMIQTTQREIIYALGETVESHFEETGGHIKRITQMMHRFSLKCGYTDADAEVLELASSMHDLGKIAIADSILKKPGKLTAEEFEIIKTHTLQGHKILSHSDLPALKLAAEIARYHHEKYDGSGYPEGLKGEEIPLSARMMAIVDVFDALTHKRVYKDASPVEEAVDYLLSEKGKHFDPALTEIFVDHRAEILREIGGD